MTTVAGVKIPFTYKCGSNVYPSTDPQDSPFSSYVCDYCGGVITFQEFGSFFIGTRDLPGDRERIQKNLRDDIDWHMKHCTGETNGNPYRN